jgi:hypothetical protein
MLNENKQTIKFINYEFAKINDCAELKIKIIGHKESENQRKETFHIAIDKKELNEIQTILLKTDYRAKLLLLKSLANEIYLDQLNDYLTIEKQAEHLGTTKEVLQEVFTIANHEIADFIYPTDK